MLGLRSGALVQEGFQAAETGSTDGEAGAVGEDGEAAIFAIGFNPGDALKIHDVRAMNPDESVGVEASFKTCDGLLL